jgi:hypothetical protein
MKTIIEQDAIVFAKVFAQKIAGFSLAKELLDKKLATYSLVKYRIIFLELVLSEVGKKESKHSNDCRTPNCNMHRDYRIAVFTLTQELERTIQQDKPSLCPEDIFTLREQLKTIQILEDFKNNFNDLKLGEEILFEEIDSLKQHFDLGKRKWSQLAKGKLMDLIAQNILEKANAPKISEIITSSAKAGYLVIA